MTTAPEQSCTEEYESIIGLEIHVELATKTKIFCGCSTSFGAPVNTQTCPVCMGMPGALPVLNKNVLDDAIALGLALNCRINTTTRFDRKNYYYPDNPQNYQISQLYSPIGVAGKVTIPVGEEPRSAGFVEGVGVSRVIRIHEIHMEEDAGKLFHDETSGETLVDYNRAGVPLIEIVTEPDMRSTEEVTSFLTKLRTMIRYLGISDCKMNEGSMRVDVNLSVRKVSDDSESAEVRSGQGEEVSYPDQKGLPATYVGDDRGAFGTRTEMKNLNSFKAISRAIESEKARQIAILESGGVVSQETRRWDDERGESFTMRSKEDMKDYRYFPDPDLPPVRIDEKLIDEIRQRLPEMQEEKAARYKKAYAIPDYDIGILTSEKTLAEIFESTVDRLCREEDGVSSIKNRAKQASNWLMGETMRIVKDRGMDVEDINIDPENLADLILLTESNKINSTTAKDVFAVIFDSEIDVKKYVEEHGLVMVSDASELETIIHTIIETNLKSVSDYKAGKTKAVGFLIGQVMKETKGKANPELVREMLEAALDNA